jgi:hypothetical protein
LSLVVFVALDSGIFRSGAYTKVASGKTVAGHFAAVARWNIATPPTPGKRDVLVLGHSKIEAALGAKIYDEENRDSHLRLIFGSSGGTTEKMWYWLLRHVDPDRRRFAAIVVPIDSYKTQAVGTDCENAIDVVQFLAPMLAASEWPDFIRSYTDPDARAKVVLGAAVSSHLYALDLQDLLLHPVDRYRSLAWAEAVAPTFLYDFGGFDGDLETFEIDRETAKILHAPPHLDAFRRAEAENSFKKLDPAAARMWTLRYYAFRKQWLGRIVDFYAGSETKVIFVQVPRWPFRMAGLVPAEDAPDIRDFLRPSKNVAVVDGDAFVDLETPHFFFDVFHVNKLARREFTVRFGQELRRILSDLP